ncbi:hypothetical protein GCM10009000_104540 [Halobacterium noricense]
MNVNTIRTAKIGGILAMVALVLLAGPASAAQATLVSMDAGSDFSGNESSVTGTVSYNSTGVQITEGGSYTSTTQSLSESADTFNYNVSSLGANVTLELYNASDSTLINSKTVSATGSGSFDVSSSSATSVYVVINVPDDADGTTSETTTVDSVSLVASNDSPSADFVDSDNAKTVAVNESVTIDASASSDPDSSDTLSFDWDKNGDGTFTDATGSSITISKSSAGTYNPAVKVTDGNGGSATATYTLTVENATGSAEITVNDPSGNVLSGATVELKNSSGTVVSTVDTNSSGVASFSGVATGDYTAVISHADYPTFTSNTFTVTENSTTSKTFSVSAGHTLDFTVQNASGTAIEGATVEVSQSGSVVKSATTDANGAASVSGLADGTYSVSVNATDYKSVSQSVDVSGDMKVTADLVSSSSIETSSMTVSTAGTGGGSGSPTDILNSTIIQILVVISALITVLTTFLAIKD